MDSYFILVGKPKGQDSFIFLNGGFSLLATLLTEIEMQESGYKDTRIFNLTEYIYSPIKRKSNSQITDLFIESLNNEY